MKGQTVKFLVVNAMLVAVSFLLTLLSFPLPLFPSWLKVDFADVSVLVGGFYCAGIAMARMGKGKAIGWGLLAVVVIEALKNLLNILIKGASFGGIGELANFIMGLCLCLPAVAIYCIKPGLKSAVLGMAVGVAAGVLAAVVTNIYLFIPATGISMEALGGAMTPLFTLVRYPEGASALWGYAFLAVVPFNLLKMIAQVVVGSLLYKHLKKVLPK